MAQFTNTLVQKLPIPQTIFRLSETAKGFMSSDELLTTELGDIMFRLANFRASILQGEKSNVANPLPVLLKLEADLNGWASALPPSWIYNVRPCIPQGSFFTNFYHTYSDRSVAVAWNQYRIFLCLVGDMLLEFMGSQATMRSNAQSSRVRSMVLNVCTDICSTVPYFLRQVNQSDIQRPGEGTLEVMWALYTCATMPCLPTEQKDWVIAQLDNFGNMMGIGYASKLARAARTVNGDISSTV